MYRANSIEGGQCIADSESVVMGNRGHEDGTSRAGESAVESIPSIWYDRGQAMLGKRKGPVRSEQLAEGGRLPAVSIEYRERAARPNARDVQYLLAEKRRVGP